MIFWLLPSVFSEQHHHQLDALRINALNNHAFLKFDIEDVIVSSWTTNRNTSDWEELYRCWISDATKFRQTNIVKVCGDITAPIFNVDIPIITIDDAVQLITMPTFLNLENSTNDLNFIKCVVDRYTRDEISKKTAQMRIVSGTGGLGEVTKAIRQHQNPLVLQFKMFLMTDSDCKQLNVPQDAVIIVRNLCVEKKVTHHILERRMIENYFPLSFLYEDKLSPLREESDIYKKVQAFNSLNQEQRYCFHLKKGLKNTNVVASVYERLSDETSDILTDGFPRLAEKYGDEDNQNNIHNLMHSISENNELKILAQKVKNHLRTPV